MTLFALLLTLCAPARAQEWTVDPSTGYFRVIVMKEGLLGGLGHDHVLDVVNAKAKAAIGESSGAVHVEINAAGVEIDQAASRAEEGFRKPIAAGDLEKIRSNMRGPKGLDVRAHPFIKFDSTAIEPSDIKGVWMVTGAFSLHGATGTLDFPVTLTPRQGGWWATGYVRVRPSEYGIKPFSVMGGLIRVQDEALVKFNLGLRSVGSAP
jgi:polyisoprenoid-binding protein YceI